MLEGDWGAGWGGGAVRSGEDCIVAGGGGFGSV